MTEWVDQIHVGDCRALMRRMIDEGVKVQCIVTSPPYWGLRDYGHAGQFGLERNWIRHVARMRAVFRLARDLLDDAGTLWLNYGDSYASSGGAGWQGKHGQRAGRTHTQRNLKKPSALQGLKRKDLVGMPWRIALALQDDGWWLRSDIIWHKPNPMPESTKDRPTKAHEYLFLFSKSSSYHYDAESIAEPTTGGAYAHGTGVNPKAKNGKVSGLDSGPGSHSTITHSAKKQDARAQIKGGDRMTGFNARYRSKQNESFSAAVSGLVEDRNARTVWTIPTQAFPGAHFATFPQELVRRCILAGSEGDDIVFDPFMGSGTVAEVALSLGRRFIGCELKPEYAALYKKHRSQQQGMAI
jgi:DNA modification methylase